MPYEFQAIRRVEFSDTDMEGIMHFSNFFRFMETAEHGFFRSLGHSVVLSRSGLPVALPRVHSECDYLAPLRFEDEVLIHMLVEKKGSRSLTFHFRFYRLGTQAPVLAARGRLVVVSVKRQKNGGFRAVPLPRVVADKIQVAPAELLNSNSPPQTGRILPSNGQPVVRAARVAKPSRLRKKA
jgi:acyl-CoA thioester hydrolase